ncbi:MAG: polysaccharide lyase family 8 super-sandwich domain-containing protein [Planctomycetota bacterium]
MLRVLRLPWWLGPWLLSLSSFSIEDSPLSDRDLVLSRYRAVLLAKPPAESDAQLAEHIDSMLPSGRWPDIDYSDRSRAGWRPLIHLHRAKSIALRYSSPDSLLYASPRALEVVQRAVDVWIERRFTSPNWWYNEIGTPRAMRDLLVVSGEDLGEQRRLRATEILEQTRDGGTAANLLWKAEIQFHAACLTGDDEAAGRAASRIWREIRVGAKEGIQSDWSFFQHAARLQAFSYGKAFLEIAIELGWQARGTSWEMPADKRSLLSSFLLEGSQWMSRGISTVPSTMDRQFSRKDRLVWADLRQLLEYWRDVDEQQREAIGVFLARQRGEAPPLVGHRHFEVADLTVHHRPFATVFLKTLSDRTLPTETTNRENLRGKPFLACGDHYILRDGKEPEGLQPTLVWHRLPGLTIADPASEPIRRSFVGGLSDGASGLTTMDTARRLSQGEEVSCQKSWFFHGDVMVCLINELKTPSGSAPLATALEQCRSREAPLLGLPSGRSSRLEGEDPFEGPVDWVLHAGIGYLPLSGAPLRVSASYQEGTWASINSRYSEETELIREPVLRVSMRHVDGLPSGFALLLDVDEAALRALTTRPRFRVLRNDDHCQAVHFANGLVMAAFLSASELRIPGEEPIRLSVDRPCLALLSADSLHLVDPTQAGSPISIGWGEAELERTLPEGGVGIEIQRPK